MKLNRGMRRSDSEPGTIHGGMTSHPCDAIPTDNTYPSPGDQLQSRRNSRQVAQKARMYAAVTLSRKLTQRLVNKSGDCNVAQSHVTNRKRKYFVDLFTTVVDMRWRWHVVMAATAFLITWSAFAGAWLAMAHFHGDVTERYNDSHQQCISNVYDVRSALLFSIETQTTIGYGSRGLQRSCPEGVVLLMIQSCIGVSIQVRHDTGETQ